MREPHELPNAEEAMFSPSDEAQSREVLARVAAAAARARAVREFGEALGYAMRRQQLTIEEFGIGVLEGARRAEKEDQSGGTEGP